MVSQGTSVSQYCKTTGRVQAHNCKKKGAEEQAPDQDNEKIEMPSHAESRAMATPLALLRRPEDIP